MSIIKNTYTLRKVKKQWVVGLSAIVFGAILLSSSVSADVWVARPAAEIAQDMAALKPGEHYQLKYGDTLWEISKALGYDPVAQPEVLSQLAEINGIDLQNGGATELAGGIVFFRNEEEKTGDPAAAKLVAKKIATESAVQTIAVDEAKKAAEAEKSVPKAIKAAADAAVKSAADTREKLEGTTTTKAELKAQSAEVQTAVKAVVDKLEGKTTAEKVEIVANTTGLLGASPTAIKVVTEHPTELAGPINQSTNVASENTEVVVEELADSGGVVTDPTDVQPTTTEALPTDAELQSALVEVTKLTGSGSQDQQVTVDAEGDLVKKRLYDILADPQKIAWTSSAAPSQTSVSINDQYSFDTEFDASSNTKKAFLAEDYILLEIEINAEDQFKEVKKSVNPGLESALSQIIIDHFQKSLAEKKAANLAKLRETLLGGSDWFGQGHARETKISDTGYVLKTIPADGTYGNFVELTKNGVMIVGFNKKDDGTVENYTDKGKATGSITPEEEDMRAMVVSYFKGELK